MFCVFYFRIFIFFVVAKINFAEKATQVEAFKLIMMYLLVGVNGCYVVGMYLDCFFAFG